MGSCHRRLCRNWGGVCQAIIWPRIKSVLIARRRQKLEELARELQAKNRIQVRILALDLSQPDFLPPILASTNGLEIGLLVNNAGFGIAGGFLDHDLERELDLLAVNCRAPLILTHAFGREMAQRKRAPSSSFHRQRFYRDSV